MTATNRGPAEPGEAVAEALADFETEDAVMWVACGGQGPCPYTPGQRLPTDRLQVWARVEHCAHLAVLRGERVAGTLSVDAEIDGTGAPSAVEVGATSGIPLYVAECTHRLVEAIPFRSTDEGPHALHLAFELPRGPAPRR